MCGCYYVYQVIRCEFCARFIKTIQRVYMMNDKPICGDVCRDRRTYPMVVTNLPVLRSLIFTSVKLSDTNPPLGDDVDPK